MFFSKNSLIWGFARGYPRLFMDCWVIMIIFKPKKNMGEMEEKKKPCNFKSWFFGGFRTSDFVVGLAGVGFFEGFHLRSVFTFHLGLGFEFV